MTKTLEKSPKIQQAPEQNILGKDYRTLTERAVERVSGIFSRQSPEREVRSKALNLMRGLGFSALKNIIAQTPDRLATAKNTIQEKAKKAKEFGVTKYHDMQDRAIDKMQTLHAEVAENEAYKEKVFRERPAFDSPSFDAERWAELGRKNALSLEMDAQSEHATDHLLGDETMALRQEINLGYTNPETIPAYPKPTLPKTIGGIALKLFQPGRTNTKS